MPEPFEEENSQEPDTLYWVVDRLRQDGDGRPEKGMVDTLENYRIAGLDGFGKKGVLDLLGTAVQEPDRLLMASSDPHVMYKVTYSEQAYVWGAKFIWQILKEIREIICTKGHGGIDLTEYKQYPKAVSVALAGVVMNAVGVKEPMALGIATLVLIALGNATKNAFCKMTDEEVIRALDPNVK